MPHSSTYSIHIVSLNIYTDVVNVVFVLQDVPNPVALEPCAGNRAAVLTLLVRQPTGNDRFTPHGYSGKKHFFLTNFVSIQKLVLLKIKLIK